ncbi:hypothetical protein ACFLV4_02440 [Chloroflexota bacterium]
MLFKHGAFVAGDHDFTLPIDTVAVVVDAAFLDLHPAGSNAIHAGTIGLGSRSLGVGDGNVFLEFRPACVLTHMGTSSIVFTRSRPGVLKGGCNLAEKEKGSALNPSGPDC